MADYGHPLRFGYFLVPNAGAPLLALAQEVERRGLDYIAVQDHPYQRRFVDTWTLLSMIGATTNAADPAMLARRQAVRPPRFSATQSAM
jgi:alkanesulfonate monooxygenase SsuD/methylene tetrahydromethanopterin reductase-like flavin-dependent oxidoreductase (luciferase family)